MWRRRCLRGCGMRTDERAWTGENPARSRPSLSAGRLAQVACLLEVTARKPGNVHRFCDFAELHYLDFLLSATAIGGPLDQAVERGIGATVLAAVKATRQVVSTNTNLGMILLLTPLAAVPLDGRPGRRSRASACGDDPGRRTTRLRGDSPGIPWRHRPGRRAGCGRGAHDDRSATSWPWRPIAT